ncbi:hypothetical protein [Qipengyuania gaetbuli]|uniref:hypothetical protein n=1 Tax=Qipengyuania gaetbuli TaxID=266952 RepID=UPI001CFD688D|nr:hypothetical protein [Qipengyuania gaetbuli]
MGSTNKRAALRKRLSSYWKLELGNALLIPAAVFYLASGEGNGIGWLTLFSFLPMCGLLLLGSAYWRAKLAGVEGDRSKLSTVLGAADRLDRLLFLLAFASLTAAIASWVLPSLSVSLADRIAATVCSVLAMLEYVNYYHRQLQHFDHGEDFRRLLGGKGFRRSQMSVDLQQYRAGRIR